MASLVVAEHDNIELKRATRHAVTAASQLEGEVHILVAGAESADVAAAAAAVAGVTKVLHADDAAYGHGLAENLAPLIAGLAESYDYLLACATTAGKNVMPRVAALLDVAQISEISEVVSADTFVRPTYAGNAMVTVRSTDARKVITVRATAFDAAAPDGGSAAVETISGAGDQGLSRFERHELSVSVRPELTSADIVVSGGRGMQSGENFPLVEAVADRLGAAVGASDEIRMLFQKEIEDSAVMLKRAYDGGVPLLCGTESGFSLTPYGDWHYRELEIFVRDLGLSPLEAITAATSANAFSLGLAHETGAIEAGRLADVIVVDGDVANDVTVLGAPGRIRHVILDGRECDISPAPERRDPPGWRATNYGSRRLTRTVIDELKLPGSASGKAKSAG